MNEVKHSPQGECFMYAMIQNMVITLDDVRAQLNAWKDLEIAKNARPVMGNGNAHARVVFIGEAPGKKEDDTGIPFMGQAGKLLNELLATINLTREDVYVTNIVKFRPPNNRDPTPQEKEACMPFLRMELDIIKPKVIVPLGRHALRQFFTAQSISEVHGAPLKIQNDITLFPMYHPAATLHNPNLRQTLYDDFKSLGEYIKSIK
jgi:DNA polymerase